MKVQTLQTGEVLFELWEEGSPVSALNYYPEYDLAHLNNEKEEF